MDRWWHDPGAAYRVDKLKANMEDVGLQSGRGWPIGVMCKVLCMRLEEGFVEGGDGVASIPLWGKINRTPSFIFLGPSNSSKYVVRNCRVSAW
jgi:hypothetical protein